MDKYLKQTLVESQKEFQRIYNKISPKSEHVDIVSQTEEDELLWEFRDNFDGYRKQNENEMWHFHYLGKSRTALPVNIFVDNANSYKRHNHQLWMYFQNDYNDTPSNVNREVLPISVEKNPRLLVNPTMLNISGCDFDKIIKFVKLNRDILTKMANRTIRDKDFYWEMDANRFTLEESFEKTLLIEMAKTVDSIETGLTVPIWLDETKQYLHGGHGPRIKFESIKGSTTDEYSSMSISDDPEVIENTFPKNATIKPWEIKLVKMFVIYNKDSLLLMIDGHINYEQFEPKMIKVDKRTGKPIYPQQQKDPNSDFKAIRNRNKLGLTMVRSNITGQLNFVNDKRIPISEKWFDHAKDFERDENSTFVSEVVIGEKLFLLYPNGEIKQM